jgi:hypothetical protein
LHEKGNWAGSADAIWGELCCRMTSAGSSFMPELIQRLTLACIKKKDLVNAMSGVCFGKRGLQDEEPYAMLTEGSIFCF